ncbi:39S ribosomal protein L47, mitochondrial [Latimeria chalumnae]|uniref:Large ribosomal subunit protein uL29m n=1 Tax=Latimeria chalumnae TaxID=7897 RepID=H3B4G0_LATCH|nr:PREDICTED: 39S ribosomal protein L47, mitochondrial [Latimeria chalumnae]|eukprot:XP_005991978.1 PREDICTED: 39S ribosomal protein L47, mitochondrial [Latimeria chalumnae]
MAASRLGNVVRLCRQFSDALTFSLAFKTQLSSRVISCRVHQRSVGINAPKTSLAEQCRSFHSTTIQRSLEEFFDDPKNWGETTVKSGAPWTVELLRAKSSEDLHKLWYVLLKEKNMLLTMEQESKRQRVQMPSPERLRKLERSMLRLNKVLEERESALRLLQTGQEKAQPGEWRKNLLGITHWYRYNEYPIPWYLNKRYKRKRFFTPPFVNHFIRLRIEKDLRQRSRKKRRETENRKELLEKFPQVAEKAQN